MVVRLGDQTESLWGIESSNEAYHEVVAKELANEILARVERCATCGGLVVRTPARGDVTA